jgi:hypothetical protein
MEPDLQRLYVHPQGDVVTVAGSLEISAGPAPKVVNLMLGPFFIA